jgi:hypothetical protein
MSVTTIRTTFGPRLLAPPSIVRVSLTQRELHSLIHVLDRDAQDAQQARRFGDADKLATRVAALRDTR